MAPCEEKSNVQISKSKEISSFNPQTSDRLRRVTGSAW
jgi:hypothetical protein